MTTFAKTLMSQNAYLTGTTAFAVDPSVGGQFGYMVDIGNFVNTEPYLSRDLIPFMLTYPKAFDLYPPATRDILVRTLKALMEVNAREITGIISSLRPEFAQVDIGGAGEIFQVVSDMKRERAEPNYTWHELNGCPVGRFLEWILVTLHMHENSKIPLIVTQGFDRAKVGALLADATTFAMMYIEPDRTGHKVVDAVICANMIPMGAGDRESKRMINGAKETRDISTTFTAFSQRGYGVIKFAQSILDKMNYTGANPQFQASAVDSIDANLKAQSSGYADQISRLSGNPINL